MALFKIAGIELATKGDLIVGGLTYGITFAADAFFFSGGASSAQSAGAAAAGVLGAKYAIQEGWKRLYGKKTPQSQDGQDASKSAAADQAIEPLGESSDNSTNKKDT